MVVLPIGCILCSVLSVLICFSNPAAYWPPPWFSFFSCSCRGRLLMPCPGCPSCRLSFMSRFGCCALLFISHSPVLASRHIGRVMCVFFWLCPFCPDSPPECHSLCPFFVCPALLVISGCWLSLLSRLSFLKAVCVSHLCCHALLFSVHVPEVTVLLLRLSCLILGCPRHPPINCPILPQIACPDYSPVVVL